MSHAVGTQGTTDGLTVTPSAARRIAAIIASESRTGLALRLSVAGGGCSGFRYDFTLDDSRNDDDAAFIQGEITVLVDPSSLDLLNGATLDYVEDLMGSSFQVRNPNATASCGCGSSFAV